MAEVLNVLVNALFNLFQGIIMYCMHLPNDMPVSYYFLSLNKIKFEKQRMESTYKANLKSKQELLDEYRKRYEKTLKLLKITAEGSLTQ